MKLFNIDSPFMQALGKMADLMWLNVLAIVCSIPIVTAGASITALHYVSLKIVRDEELYITKSFFKSFKENFKQSTAIWMIYLIFGLIIAWDYYLLFFSNIEYTVIAGKFATAMKIILLVVTILFLFSYMFVFPLQAKFANPIKATIKNSFLVSIMQAPKTFCMIVLLAVPFLIEYYVPRALPIVLLFGASGQSFLAALMYNKFFKKLEDNILGINPPEDLSAEDEHIFSDEVIEDTSKETTEE